MESVVFRRSAIVLVAAAGPSSDRTIRIPITRVGTVPVPGASETLGTCHNRWHPAIRPAATANPGDTVIFETRDALDNPFNRSSTPATVAAANLNLVHPLTGPLFVNGARRGDVLAVTMVHALPGPDHFGYTVVIPAFGILRDVFPNPAIVHWELGGVQGENQFATSRDIPGVRIPLHGFAGTIAVALGRSESETAFLRAGQLRRAGGVALPPARPDAAPAAPR